MTDTGPTHTPLTAAELLVGFDELLRGVAAPAPAPAPLRQDRIGGVWRVRRCGCGRPIKATSRDPFYCAECD